MGISDFLVDAMTTEALRTQKLPLKAQSKLFLAKQEYAEYMNSEKGKSENFALEFYFSARVKQAETGFALKLHQQIKNEQYNSSIGVQFDFTDPSKPEYVA
jgi:hypothetical protein